ncbi:MAG: hypothetical protein NC548_15935 [Lachnospiraceae bacterium]|nr:hypothetical protein [Lachnospiraceae bacterium]
MADNKPSSWFKRVNKELDNLDRNMDSIYQTTYSSRSDNRRDLDNIVTTIDDTVDKIVNGGNGPKLSDLSNLYMRIQKKKGVSNTNIVKGAMELFADNNIINSLSMNQDYMKYIYAEDYQYDMICKYMPALETALDIKKDNVLSSDSFSKDFLNIQSDSTTPETFKIFNDRAKRVVEKYKFQDICEEMYHRASHYGEAFVYIVPYHIAIQRLLKRRASFNKNGIVNTYHENAKTRGMNPTKTCILESSNISNDPEFKEALDKAKISVSEMKDLKVNIIFDDYHILSEAVEEKEAAMRITKKYKEQSLNEQYSALYEQALQEADGDKSKIKFGSIYRDKYSASVLDGGVNDGLIVNDGSGKKLDETVNEMNGAVISLIDRGDLLPVYMDDLCAGYYHFSYNYGDMNTCRHGFAYGNTTPGFGGVTGASADYNMSDQANDMLIGLVAQRISDNIDAHFINANKDLKEEIYAILKYNDKFSAVNGVNNVVVSFLPADDVYHFYLKQDRKTKRGISSLRKSVVSAMMYCLLYLTNTIGQVTRAQDKRVYYVKQNVETNVARTLMNVVNQIKKGNMGMRQIESMNSILGVVGKYNDHIIPEGQSGEAPIRFEVMEGQRLETPTELMERFLNDAVESTDVPYEFTQSVNQVDYATRFTMSNSKFLRKVYKEQRICQQAFSYIFTKLYNYEYGENEKLIKVLLPAPAYLSMINTQELINNTNQYAQAICDIEMQDAEEEVKSEFKKIIVRDYLGTYIDYTKIDEAKNIARMTVEYNKSLKSA